MSDMSLQIRSRLFSFTLVVMLAIYGNVRAVGLADFDDAMQEAQTVNDTRQQKQAKKVADYLKKVLDQFGPYNGAAGYCFQVRNEDAKNGCLSRVAKANNDLTRSQSHCLSIKSADARNACMAGYYLAQGSGSMAQSQCLSIRDTDSRNACFSEIEASQGKATQAESYCLAIRIKDAKSSCSSGIYAAKGDHQRANSYCHAVSDPDTKNVCYSGAEIVRVAAPR